MNRLYLILILSLMVLTSSLTANGQRRISPVNNPATTTQARNENKLPGDSINRDALVEYRDNKGNIILVDTISGKEIVDSTALPVVPPMLYPLVYDASIGVNIWDPLMRAFGQKYGLIGFSAHFNMHNRYIAAFEFGLGDANDTPADNNYTYHQSLAPYFKLGIDYNFLYNSNPDYMMFAGLRYGFSAFKWTLRDVSSNNDYWGEPSDIPFPNINATAGYLEFLFGLKVKIIRNISMGWTFRYHRIIHEAPKTNGRAWYIPGYGTRNSAIGASLSIYYTIPLKGKRQAKTLQELEATDITGSNNRPENNQPVDTVQPDNSNPESTPTE